MWYCRFWWVTCSTVEITRPSNRLLRKLNFSFSMCQPNQQRYINLNKQFYFLLTYNILNYSSLTWSCLERKWCGPAVWQNYTHLKTKERPTAIISIYHGVNENPDFWFNIWVNWDNICGSFFRRSIAKFNFIFDFLYVQLAKWEIRDRSNITKQPKPS